MAKTLQFVRMIWGFISMWFLKFGTHAMKGQKQSNELGDILKWQREEVTKLQEVLKAEQVLNEKQCINLVEKLDQVVLNVNEMMTSTKGTSNDFGLMLGELCRITRKVRILVEDCGKQEWWNAAAFQMNNREAFRELVYDVKCIWDAICEIYSPLCAESQHGIPCIDFNVATFDENQGDEEDLEKMLSICLQTTPNHKLAKYLLKRVQYDLQQAKGAELDVTEISQDFIKPEFSRMIGSGQTGKVYKSNWMGLESATKVMKDSLNCLKEAKLLSGLSHPNIIKFIGCGTNKNLEDCVDEAYELYLVMEFMETNWVVS